MLNSGERNRCDLVIMAIGVSPQTELAKSAGITVNRGIVVDRRMMTNIPHIYACGDVAESYDFVLEGNRLTPLWPNAYIGGRTAGFNMAGIETEYTGGTAMNSINYFGLSIATAGIVSAPEDQQQYETLMKSNGTIYRKVLIHDNRIVGFILVGDIDKAGILFGLMREKIDVGAFKSHLLADDFGLAYLPENIRREHLGETVVQ
jgi:NAD(P)H-nitrite reductase large subunit